MCTLEDVFQEGCEHLDIKSRQFPLVIDKNVTFIMDISKCDIICENQPAQGKQLTDFMKNFQMLDEDEQLEAFTISSSDTLTILDQSVPCVGCRRSVERVFYELTMSNLPALDPLIITSCGVLQIKEEVMKSPKVISTLLNGNSDRLTHLMETQQRSKKSGRCLLHSMETQRIWPPVSAWKEIWDVMKCPCRQEVCLIKSEILETFVDSYIVEHKFCAECRSKVHLAFTLLTKEENPKEKFFVPALYEGIKRCIPEGHIHLPTDTNYIGKLIERTQTEILGRERHAKTLKSAQEEVLTCLGLCIVERLHHIHRRFKEEEITCKILAAVGMEAFSRKFKMAIEKKQGVTQMDIFYEQLVKEKAAKEQKREKLRLKRKLKKERRNEIEEKENTCEPSSNEAKTKIGVCKVVLEKNVSNNERVKNNCKDRKKNKHSNNSTSTSEENISEKNKEEDEQGHQELLAINERLTDLTVKSTKEDEKKREQSSQDFGYSSEQHSSRSSIPSTPELPEDEQSCNDKHSSDKSFYSDPGIYALKEFGGGVTLTQLLEDSYFLTDEKDESCIPLEEILSYKLNIERINEERQNLRETVKKRFELFVESSRNYHLYWLRFPDRYLMCA